MCAVLVFSFFHIVRNEESTKTNHNGTFLRWASTENEANFILTYFSHLICWRNTMCISFWVEPSFFFLLLTFYGLPCFRFFFSTRKVMRWLIWLLQMFHNMLLLKEISTYRLNTSLNCTVIVLTFLIWRWKVSIKIARCAKERKREREGKKWTKTLSTRSVNSV